MSCGNITKLLVLSFVLLQVNEILTTPFNRHDGLHNPVTTTIATTTMNPQVMTRKCEKYFFLAPDTYTWNPWPKIDSEVIIPFEIPSNFTEQERALIRRTIAYFNSISCHRWVERSELDSLNLSHLTYYVHIEKQKHTSSFSDLGWMPMKKAGRQLISCGPACIPAAPEKMTYSSSLLHEMFHTVGFVHEQSRPDRDLYIKIIYCNILFGEYMTNYQVKIGTPNIPNLGSDYDYASLMHYYPVSAPGTEGSKMEFLDGRPQDLAKAQRSAYSGPTQLDSLKLNIAGRCSEADYKCSDPENADRTYYPGYEYKPPNCRPTETLVGSEVRRCIYGKGWTGIASLCLPTSAVTKCDFETRNCPQMFSDFLSMTRTAVVSLFYQELHHDLTKAASVTGHVLVFEVSLYPAVPELYPKLPTVWFDAASNDTFCLRYGYFSSSSTRIYLKVYATIQVFQSSSTAGHKVLPDVLVFSSSVNAKDLGSGWRHKQHELQFLSVFYPSGRQVKLAIVFQAVLAPEVDTSIAEDFLALDEISLARNSHCDGKDSVTQFTKFD